MNFERHHTTDNQPESFQEGEVHQRERLAQERLTYMLDLRSEMFDNEVLEKIQEINPDYAYRKPQVETYAHNNLDIRFVGVSHTAENLTMYRKEIEQEVARADIVVLEMGYEASEHALAARVLTSRTITVPNTDQDIQITFPVWEPNTNSGAAFFYEVENMVKKYQKLSVTLDPWSDQRALRSKVFDNNKYLSRLLLTDKVIQGLTAVVASGSLMGSVALLGRGLADNNIAASAPLKNDHPDELRADAGMSRRQFLKKGAYLAAGGLAAVVGGTAVKNILESEHEIAPSDVLTSYHLDDFRNVSIAQGIDRLSESFSKKIKVAIVYGRGHGPSIQYYLQHPHIRTAKQNLYAPFRTVAPPEMSVYKYQLRPGVVSGEVDLKSSSEFMWGDWNEVARTRLP